MFYVAYRTLLLMFCVLKFSFVNFHGMFTSSPTWRLKMHVLCKVGKNIIFQNKTLLVMFYRHNKTFWYKFCNFKHFLKAENSKDSLASLCVELSIGLSCNPVWDWVTVGTSHHHDAGRFHNVIIAQSLPVKCSRCHMCFPCHFITL